MQTQHQCQHCQGSGIIEEDVNIAYWQPPARHDKRDELLAIVADAKRAISDHKKLVEMNPRATASYDNQLQTTLAKLDADATAIL